MCWLLLWFCLVCQLTFEEGTLSSQLKLPGYSEYLHPVNSTHIIGVGKDAAVETVRSWTRAIPLGVKLGMFDITNVTAPRELFNAQLGVRGTSSPVGVQHIMPNPHQHCNCDLSCVMAAQVLNDAKAFLFDASRQLMVLPARLYLFAPSGAAPTADAAQAGSQYTVSGGGGGRRRHFVTIVGWCAHGRAGVDIWQLCVPGCLCVPCLQLGL